MRRRSTYITPPARVLGDAGVRPLLPHNYRYKRSDGVLRHDGSRVSLPRENPTWFNRPTGHHKGFESSAWPGVLLWRTGCGFVDPLILYNKAVAAMDGMLRRMFYLADTHAYLLASVKPHQGGQSNRHQLNFPGGSMCDFPSIYRYARTRTRSTGAPHSAAELDYATTRLHPATGQQPPKPDSHPRPCRPRTRPVCGGHSSSAPWLLTAPPHGNRRKVQY